MPTRRSRRGELHAGCPGRRNLLYACASLTPAFHYMPDEISAKFRRNAESNISRTMTPALLMRGDIEATGQSNDPFVAPGSQNQSNCRSVGNDR
jgi:hypothetical protein